MKSKKNFFKSKGFKKMWAWHNSVQNGTMQQSMCPAVLILRTLTQCRCFSIVVQHNQDFSTIFQRTTAQFWIALRDGKLAIFLSRVSWDGTSCVYIRCSLYQHWCFPNAFDEQRENFRLVWVLGRLWLFESKVGWGSEHWYLFKLLRSIILFALYPGSCSSAG